MQLIKNKMNNYYNYFNYETRDYLYLIRETMIEIEIKVEQRVKEEERGL